MNSEPSANEIVISTTDEALKIDFPQVVQPNAVQYASDQLEVNSEGEEFAFTKAATLLLNPEQEAEEHIASTFKSAVDVAPRYYVQGVVMGKRACIITNLMGGSSQTLFQPQMVWTIGRNREAALPLRDRVLSRRHAVILYVPAEGFYLVDLNSMNGSFLNGARVYQRQPLNDGDLLRLGSIEFSFFVSGNARTIEPIHPEVLTRFTNPTSRSEEFIDYAALEEPEILFGSTREG
ncbi:MAG: FHA domain-containing protein [Leptolyngbyaceae cyanobacterium bins.302]|nr:FHA domain-containing protein [Leptolyngbyaceae cyanobacterium bins.302]